MKNKRLTLVVALSAIAVLYFVFLIFQREREKSANTLRALLNEYQITSRDEVLVDAVDSFKDPGATWEIIRISGSFFSTKSFVAADKDDQDYMERELKSRGVIIREEDRYRLLRGEAKLGMGTYCSSSYCSVYVLESEKSEKIW